MEDRGKLSSNFLFVNILKDCEDVGSIRHCGKVRLSSYGYLCKFEFFGAHK